MRPADPNQPALFGSAPAKPERRAVADPHIYLPANPRPTQVKAAARALPRSGTQRARVLDAIRLEGVHGLTDEEIGARLRLSLNSVRPRRLELVEAGQVVASELRRPTRTGGAAIVWIAAEFAEEAG